MEVSSRDLLVSRALSDTFHDTKSIAGAPTGTAVSQGAVILRACKILVVDDDSHLRQLLRSRLLREGYIVEETDTGRMALSSFRLNPADLVIVHVTDPEQAGFETIRALRALSVTVPILAMLGESLANLPTQSIIVQNLGASRTLQTAVESDQLLGIVARLLIRVEAPS